jgi:hypothetical protein
VGDVLKFTPGAVTSGATVAFFTDTSLTTPTSLLRHRPTSPAPIPTIEIKVGGAGVQAQVLTDQDASGVDGQIPAVYAPDASTSPIYMAELDYNLSPVSSTKQTLTGTDPQGAPVGPAQTFVQHGSTANTARPSTSGPVTWVGSVSPTNAIAGDYWQDTTTDPYTLKIRGASAFALAAGTLVASGIAVTPTGGITSANVQAALAELDTKKATPATAQGLALVAALAFGD